MTNAQDTDTPTPGRVQRRAEGLVAEYIHELSPHAGQADEASTAGDDPAEAADS